MKNSFAPPSYNISFRPFTEADFPLMLEWLARPHVKEWWDDGDDTLEKVAAHYSKESDTERFILMLDEGSAAAPVGYFQYYRVGEQVIGIDQFIGEPQLINKGLGTLAVCEFVLLIRLQENPTSIILDPDSLNSRAIRCYEKAGFRHYETVAADDGHTAYMMRLDLGSDVAGEES